MRPAPAPAPVADEEDDCGDLPVDALPGHVGPSGERDEPAALLLEMITAVARLAVLLSELDEKAFRALTPRRLAFLSLVFQLPTEAPLNPGIGFRPPKGKPGKRKTTKGRR